MLMQFEYIVAAKNRIDNRFKTNCVARLLSMRANTYNILYLFYFCYNCMHCTTYIFI